MSRVIKLGQVKSVTPSPGYIGYYPCFQVSPDVMLTDRSGQNNHATFGTDQLATPAWATASRFTVAEDVSGTKDYSASLAIVSSGPGFNWSPSTESFLASFRLTMATPASNRPLLGTTQGTPNVGFELKVTATGKARFDLHSATSDYIFNSTSASVADGALHSVCLAYDATTKRVYVVVDGVIDAGFGAGGIDLSARTDWYPFTRKLVIGGVGANSNKAITAGQSGFAWHLVKRTGGLPANWANLAARLHVRPTVLISASEFPA